MTIYRSLLRLVLFLLMAGGPMVWAPWAQAHVAPHAPTKAVTLSVVASSRKGLGGRYVYSPWVFNIANMTLGPHGGIYFDGWSGPIIHITPDHKVLVVARPQSEGWDDNHELFGTFSSLAVLPNGDLYALYNSVLFRISPKGQLIFVPLRSPTGQLLPNPNAPPYPYPARYPSLEYLATGPRGHVYVSTGGLPSMNGKPTTGETYRVGPDNRGIPVRWCEAPAQVHTQAVSGPHDTVYAAVGSYIEAAVPGCPLITAQWTILFYNPKLNFRGLPAISPHGHFLYVTSRRTIYRMPLPSVPKVNDKRK